MKHLATLVITSFMLISCTNNTKNSFSFELASGSETDWAEVEEWEGSSGGIRSNGFYSPPDGISYACQEGGGAWTTRETGHKVEAGLTYTLSLWSRSVNKPGNTTHTILDAGFLRKGEGIITKETNVNAPQLKGAAATEPNDDGANIWVDGDFRHQFNEVHMYQPLHSDL